MLAVVGWKDPLAEAADRRVAVEAKREVESTQNMSSSWVKSKNDTPKSVVIPKVYTKIELNLLLELRWGAWIGPSNVCTNCILKL